MVVSERKRQKSLDSPCLTMEAPPHSREPVTAKWLPFLLRAFLSLRARACLTGKLRAECSGVGMDVSLHRFMESMGAVASPPRGAGARSRLWLSPSCES